MDQGDHKPSRIGLPESAAAPKANHIAAPARIVPPVVEPVAPKASPSKITAPVVEPPAPKATAHKITPPPPPPVTRSALPPLPPPRVVQARVMPAPPPAPKAAPLAPPAPAPQPTADFTKIKTPEQARYARLCERAYEINPKARCVQFEDRLRALLKIPAENWYDWGQATLEENKRATERFTEIAKDLGTLDTAKWITATKEAATKEPGFLERLTAKPPAYYEAKLQQIRGSLNQLIGEIDPVVKTLGPIVDRFIWDVLALQVASEGMTKPTDVQIADSRLRVLLGAQQSISLTLQGLESTKATIVQSIQTIDMLLTQTIPQWNVAHAKLK